MSDFSALNTAITGLHAHRKRIDVIGENIANIDTPGYHRQTSTLSAIDTRRPGLFSGSGGRHGGVITDVGRRWDQLLDNNAKEQRSRSASIGAQAEALATVEAQLGSLGESGFGSRLQALWNSFDDLANQPDDVGVRNVVLGNAELVASSLRRQAEVIEHQRVVEIDHLSTSVAEINSLAAGIAELDRTIVAGVAAGNDPHGAMDERDRMTTELVGIVGGKVSYAENGGVRFSVDGYNLVADGQSATVSMASIPDPALNDVGYPKLAVVAASGRELRLIGGTVNGGLQVVNDRLTVELRALNDMAALTAASVNALHQAGSGLDGSTGSSLFDPAGTTAKTFALSGDVRGQPVKLAASDGSALLDNSVALALAGLGDDPNGPSAAHFRFVTNLGGTVRALNNQADVARLASEHADSANQAATGVDLDEELADLMSAQRAYEASSRVISAVDEMLDVLINRTGIVGR